MPRYLISFSNTAMDHIPEAEMPDVADASHAVVREAQDAGVWIFGGGMSEDVEPVLVAGDGTLSAGSYPLGGMSIIDAPSLEKACEWAAKIAVACRCPQVVSEFMFDPLV
jgi:hypothetical protein